MEWPDSCPARKLPPTICSLLACDHFGVSQHQRADTLGIVADHRLAEVVGQGAVAVILAAKTRHQADAVQLQTAIRVLERYLSQVP